MGVNVSNQMIDSTTSMVSNALNEISADINNSASSYTMADQEMSIVFDGVTAIDSTFNFNQTMNLTVSTMLESSSDLSNDLSNKLESKLQETLSNELKQANEDLNLGQLNISNAQTSTNAYIEQNLSTIIKTGVDNSVKQDTEGRQYFAARLLNSTFKNSTYNNNQEMVMDLVAKNVSTNVVKNVIKNAIKGDVQKKIKNKADQLNAGVDIMAMFSVIIVIVGGVVFASSSKTINTAKTGGNNEELHIGGANNKKKLALGAIVILILVFVIFVFAKKWIASKYDTSYLGDLEPETKSGFCARPRMFYRRQEIRHK